MPPRPPIRAATAAAASTTLVDAAKDGDAAALGELIAGVRDAVYRLAIRMVTRPSEAEDATQEILIRVMTRISTFRGEAAFSTWVHRIAVNYLLDQKKSMVERAGLSFDMYAADLRTGLADPHTAPGPDAELLVTELRLSCTQAMLTCLDRDHRVAYVLGEIFEVSSEEGAYICSVAPATYRKRLSRARSRVRGFLDQNCGLVNPNRAECRCSRRVERAVALGRIDPKRLEYAEHPATRGVSEMEQLCDAAGLMRNHPDYSAPERLAEGITRLIESGRYGLLSDPG